MDSCTCAFVDKLNDLEQTKKTTIPSSKVHKLCTSIPQAFHIVKNGRI